MRCQLTVRTLEGTRRWEHLPDWSTMVVLGSLSADPETWEDLSAAVRRYQPEHRLDESASQANDWLRVADEGPWCVVDVVGKTVMAGGGFELPEIDEAYGPEPEDEKAGLVQGYDTVWTDWSDDWDVAQAGDGWRERLERRAAAARDRPRLDPRPVLFGLPMLEHLAQGVLASSAEHSQWDDQEQLRRTRAIHAAWLMTPRDDLLGKTPRQLLLSDRERLDRDLQHRAYQWTEQGFPPIGLATHCAAYRFAGFGTAQVVLYFDLVRALLDAVWDWISGDRGVACAALVDRLLAYRDEWLDSPHEVIDAYQTPGELMELERQRIPAVSESEPFFDDCPICVAQKSIKTGPCFAWFDGHHLELEDEFAFSLLETYEEWEIHQEAVHALCEPQENHRPAVATGLDSPIDEPIWRSSYVNWDEIGGPGLPKNYPRFALGFPLAEFVTELKKHPDTKERIAAINQVYARFMQAEDIKTIASSAEQLRELLEESASSHPELTPMSADLQSRLDEVLRAGAR